MQKAVKIKIRDVSLNVEETAVLILENYLNSVRNHFMAHTDGEEIIADIESSLAESAYEMVGKKDDILSKSQVEALIEAMGSVKDMDGEATEKRTWSESVKYKLENFKLMRDTFNQQVAGVCSGLGMYFRIDPVFFRLLFSIVAIYGLFQDFRITMGTIAVYTIFWIAMPAAKTTVQRLEMKGENITLGNIEKELKQSKPKEMSNGAAISNVFESFFGFVGIAIKKCFELGLRGTGLLIVLGGIGGIFVTLIGFFSATFTPELIMGGHSYALTDVPNFQLLVWLALIAGLSGFTLCIELGMVLVLLKNILKLIPTVLLLALTLLCGALLFVLGLQSSYNMRYMNVVETDNNMYQENIIELR